MSYHFKCRNTSYNRPLLPHYDKHHPLGATGSIETSAPKHTLSLNCATAHLLFHWTVTPLCAWVTAASITFTLHPWKQPPSAKLTGNNGWIWLVKVLIRAKRINRILLVRWGCLSRQERDEDDTNVMASCVSVAMCSCGLLVSWLNIPYFLKIL